ncbi:MAG TPA: hypothetical protein VH165_05895 [Kofleriaceae bacterium]|nr:hypothetical protein [Kofleriaceae bacterium]
MKQLLQLAIAVSLAIPTVASAGVYNIHVGGICSSDFGSTLGQWSGETSINAPIDQSTSMVTATSNMVTVLNQYCTGNNLCYVYVYSNGGAVMSRTLALNTTAWNIGYVAASASNEGGSELGGTGYIGEVFGGCTLAGHIGVSDHRNGWNHNDTHGIVTGMIAGDGWLSPYVQSAILPGHDDGAVSEASAGGYAAAGSHSSICEAGTKYANHQAWYSCEYGSLNHLDMKLKMVCDDGGLTSGCP